MPEVRLGSLAQIWLSVFAHDGFLEVDTHALVSEVRAIGGGRIPRVLVPRGRRRIDDVRPDGRAVRDRSG